jgi:molybdopterin-guanine dinucleotide biosynthesis protein A
MNLVRPPVTGVILAGGRGRRMGGQDKGLIERHGRTLVESVLEQLVPQVDELIINANRNTDRYAQFDYPVITDVLPDYPGPLAGMLTGLLYAANEYVVFVPCDTWLLPDRLVERLWQGMQAAGSPAVFAHDGERAHPVFALLQRSCQVSLQTYMEGGHRKAEVWLKQAGATPVDFSDDRPAFANINLPTDL